MILGVSGKVNTVAILSAKPSVSVVGGVLSATPSIEGIILVCDACVFACDGAALL